MKNKNYTLSLYLFRRDLRLFDNTALIHAARMSTTIIPCFIFDPRQVLSRKNNYFSPHALTFMINTLNDLNLQLKKKGGSLFFFYGNPYTVIKKIHTSLPFDALFFNKDYTPFSINRDRDMERFSHQHSCAYLPYDDALLHEPSEVLKKDGTPYSIFSAFYKKALTLPLASPKRSPRLSLFKHKIAHSLSLTTLVKKLKLTTHFPELHSQGGSSECKKRITLIRHLKHYHKTRNYPAIPTSYLSPHLKFGTLSVRYAAAIITKELSPHHDLIRQLYWRDFYTYIAYHSPFVFGSSYKDKYNQLTWSKSKLRFKKWQQGLTGFPIVDAGMRQLNTTGFMHNRVRMITASFLIKDLHINWQWGERYFAQKLVDYDPSVNNGNWQWVASTGCDAAPYFRIFNPWLQQKKYDPQCIYIKQWIPELKDIPSQIIHTWYKKYTPKMKSYPYPMVNHEKESKTTSALYRSTS